jgi:phosphonate transport system substrate-binding protein
MSGQVLLGAVAYHPRVVTVWERFRAYFADAGIEMDYVLYSNYERLVDAVADGAVGIGWNTNTAYLSLDERMHGATTILGMRDVDRDWATVVVARRDREIADLTELAGKTVALGSRDSGHAAILPLHYLSGVGLEATRDYRAIRFDTDLGKHGDTGNSERHVVRAVAAGDADAGAISQAYLSVMRAERVPEVADLEVVWRSPAYYHCNFTALGSFDESVGRAWIEALLAMDYNDPDLRPAMDLEGVRRWYAGDDAGYSSLREAIHEQRVSGDLGR